MNLLTTDSPDLSVWSPTVGDPVLLITSVCHEPVRVVNAHVSQVNASSVVATTDTDDEVTLLNPVEGGAYRTWEFTDQWYTTVMLPADGDLSAQVKAEADRVIADNNLVAGVTAAVADRSVPPQKVRALVLEELNRYLHATAQD